jgi:hypothetical protein
MSSGGFQGPEWVREAHPQASEPIFWIHAISRPITCFLSQVACSSQNVPQVCPPHVCSPLSCPPEALPQPSAPNPAL